MDADVGQGTATGQSGIVDPGPGALVGRITELDPDLFHPADLPGHQEIPDQGDALAEAEDLRHTQWEVCIARSRRHLAGLATIHGQGLLAQHRVAGRQRGQYIRMMAGVRGSHQDGVHLAAAAELLDTGEGMRDAVALGGGPGRLRVPSGEGGHPAPLRGREPGHQAFDRMQAETDDAEADQVGPDHGSSSSEGAPPA